MLGRLLAGRVATEYSLLRQRFLCISAGFRSRQGFPGHDKAFSGFVSRQEFLCHNMILRF